SRFPCVRFSRFGHVGPVEQCGCHRGKLLTRLRKPVDGREWKRRSAWPIEDRLRNGTTHKGSRGGHPAKAALAIYFREMPHSLILLRRVLSWPPSCPAARRRFQRTVRRVSSMTDRSALSAAALATSASREPAGSMTIGTTGCCSSSSTSRSSGSSAVATPPL